MAKKITNTTSLQPLAPLKPTEGTGFYNMPDSPATDLILEVLGAGERIADLPERKQLINHNTSITVSEQGKKRRIATKSQKSEVTIELADIDKVFKNNKPAKKFFILTLIKANQQAVHDGQLTRDSVSFPLQELIDIGFYSTPQSARKGFKAAYDTLASVHVRGKIFKNKNKVIDQEKMRVLITGYDIDKGQCVVYLNEKINWSFLVQFFTILPLYYFRLPNRASDLLYYIFFLARQHTRDIAERGYFTISFRAIQQRLQLPNEVGLNNPLRDIKQPIEDAIEAIETEHSLNYGNTDFQLLPVCDEAANIGTYLDEGYLKVTLLGNFAKSFIDMSKETAKQIEQAQKRQERIAEKAVAIKAANALEAAEKKERAGT